MVNINDFRSLAEADAGETKEMIAHMSKSDNLEVSDDEDLPF